MNLGEREDREIEMCPNKRLRGGIELRKGERGRAFEVELKIITMRMSVGFFEGF